MKDFKENFGLIIAFLLPGFLLLWGMSFSFSDLHAWLMASGEKDSPTVGGFLYATLASLMLGLLISGVRWAIVDHLMRLKIKFPELDYGKLKEEETLAAYTAVVDNHYRYYQYYSNSAVAFIFSSALFLLSGQKIVSFCAGILIVALIEGMLLWASYDCLQKYCKRSSQILK